MNHHKLVEESSDCPPFISELITFCYKHDQEKFTEIIKKYKEKSELIDVSEIDYDKIKKI